MGTSVSNTATTSAFGTILDEQEIKNLRATTPYGRLSDEGIRYLIEQGICRFVLGVWVFRIYSVDARKREYAKDGRMYRSDGTAVVFVPYMAYVFEYLVQRFADLHEISKQAAMNKIFQKNLPLKNWFVEVDEKLGYFGLSAHSEAAKLQKPKNESQQIPQESMPF